MSWVCVHLPGPSIGEQPGFDVGGITQEDPTQPRANWQAAYDRRLLTLEGNGERDASWPIPRAC